MKKNCIVVHSGGMDSSICLALACKEFGNDSVLSLSFSYNQRHSSELIQAKKICDYFKVDHTVIDLSCLNAITENALTNKALTIEKNNHVPNTLVMGRNGLFATLAAIHADHLGAETIFLGIIGVEGEFSGYRDCSRDYMDLKEKIMRIDLGNPAFSIRTPLVHMTKKETLELAKSLGVLDFLLENTITCYEGIIKEGCKVCPACILKAKGIQEYHQSKK